MNKIYVKPKIRVRKLDTKDLMGVNGSTGQGNAKIEYGGKSQGENQTPVYAKRTNFDVWEDD
jgi:hypothetical protein